MKLCLSCHLEFTDEMDVCPKDNVTLVTLGDDPLIGNTLQDRYKIESVIGRGAMGAVYKATQEIIGREVAIKVLHTHLVDDNDALKRFHQQAKAASRLNHPHIITLYDYGVMSGGQPYIVMDLLKGTAMSRILEEREYLPLEEAVPLIKQICEALGDAHKHGVVHRDVKPDNIVLEEQNDNKLWVKVVDFGIAKIVQGGDETLVRITRTGMVCGSPAYMSPEQFQGDEVDARSDIYSLAVLIFEMLTGRLPFQAKDLVGLMSLHVSDKPPSMKKVRPDLDFPPELEKALEHAMNKNVEGRPASMDDFWQELEAGFAARHKISRSGAGPALSSGGTPEQQLSGKDIQELVSAKISAKSKQVEDEIQKWARATVSQVDNPSGQAITQRAPRTRASIPWWAKAVGMAQSTMPFVFTLALMCGLYWFTQGDSELASALRDRLKTSLPFLSRLGLSEPAQLFSAGRLSEAVSLLEQKKATGRLSQPESDLLNKCYLHLSNEEAKKKNYKAAIALLAHVSGKGVHSSKAKALIKRYKRMLDK
jgi:serine/threonine-protein kinase